jgi:hypothetical protein
MCVKFVKDTLKAPSSADFPSYGDDGTSVTETTNNMGYDSYTVSGYVDAENSFGAKLRQTWLCDTHTYDGTNWQGSANVLGG